MKKAMYRYEVEMKTVGSDYADSCWYVHAENEHKAWKRVKELEGTTKDVKAIRLVRFLGFVER